MHVLTVSTRDGKVEVLPRRVGDPPWRRICRGLRSPSRPCEIAGDSIIGKPNSPSRQPARFKMDADKTLKAVFVQTGCRNSATRSCRKPRTSGRRTSLPLKAITRVGEPDQQGRQASSSSAIRLRPDACAACLAIRFRPTHASEPVSSPQSGGDDRDDLPAGGQRRPG